MFNSVFNNVFNSDNVQGLYLITGHFTYLYISYYYISKFEIYIKLESMYKYIEQYSYLIHIESIEN